MDETEGGPSAEAALRSALLEQGRLLFAGPCGFVAGADNAGALPPPDLPEVAFAGRSNVGKSSLVNALTGRNTLARTSITPGRTQQLNFFRLGDTLTLVDLPGYGYAKAPKRQAEAWTRLTRAFLRGRTTLARVCLLIDGRHGVKPVDEETMALFDSSAVGYQVVLTKCDKVPAAELAERLAATTALLARHVAAHPRTLATSSLTGAGIPELRAHLAALATGQEFR